MDAIFQSLPEPDFDLSGGTLGNNLGISGESIYNLSAETGMDLNIFLSGNTADFINKQAYLKLDVYPYEFSKKNFHYNQITDMFLMFQQESLHQH